MFLGSRLTRQLGSRRMFIIALVIYSLRMLLYSVIPSATWLLAVPFHGCSFGLYLIASVTLVHELVVRSCGDRAGTARLGNGLRSMSGALISGVLLDRVGIFAIYRLGRYHSARFHRVEGGRTALVRQPGGVATVRYRNTQASQGDPDKVGHCIPYALALPYKPRAIGRFDAS